MPRRELNKANAAKKNGYLLGHSNIFATLSQVLTYNNIYIIKKRGHPREYTAFLAEMQGRPHCFLVQSKRAIQSNINP